MRNAQQPEESDSDSLFIDEQFAAAPLGEAAVLHILDQCELLEPEPFKAAVVDWLENYSGCDWSNDTPQEWFGRYHHALGAAPQEYLDTPERRERILDVIRAMTAGSYM